MSTAGIAFDRSEDRARLALGSLVAAVAGLIAFVVLALTPVAGQFPLAQAAISYSVAFHFWLAIPTGCLVVLMIQYLTGGAWGVLLRPVLESAAGTLWLMAILFIPIAASLFLGPVSPYPWARPPEYVARGEVIEELHYKTQFLNPPLFILRSAGYFAVLITLSYLLRSWAAKWRDGDEAAGQRLPALSGPGLVVYAATITFASMDWVMSLEPFWHSTLYPPLYAIGQVAAGFAFATVAAVLLSRYPPLDGRVNPKHLRDLGGLLLAFIMFWAYFLFSQFMLIWAGNLTEEIPYYLKRMQGGWQWIGVGLVVLHFAVPFLLLLFRGIKEDGKALLWVAIGVLAMRFIDGLWWIEPAFPHEDSDFFWLLDVSAFVAIGGLWMWLFLSRLQRVSLEPVHGPFQCEEASCHG